MTEPIAYYNGAEIPVSQLSVSPFDLGFTMGTTVTEMFRTFGHEPYQLDAHLARLSRSLEAVSFPIYLR